MSTKEIAKNLASINSAIKEALKNAKRPANPLLLLAVSKGQDFETIKAAYDLGLRDFGENYVLEWLKKAEQADKAGLHDIKWHFLGAIQSNKIKHIARFSLVHSVASVSQAQLLNKVVDNKLDIFLQVNLSVEQSSQPSEGLGPARIPAYAGMTNDKYIYDERQGFSSNKILEAIAEIKQLPKLNIRGLMTILPLNPKKPAQYWFKEMLELKEKIESQGSLASVQLSMGMSEDFGEAIIFGANIIRIGTKLFGPRLISK